MLVAFIVLSCEKQDPIADLAIPRVVALQRTDTFLLKRLDSAYVSAVSIDTSDRVFTTAEDEARLWDNWVEFHNQFASYLTSKKLHLQGSPQTFITLYCAASGSVDHAAYAFNVPIDSLVEAQYAALLEEFTKTHGLGMSAPRPFSQCGTVGY